MIIYRNKAIRYLSIIILCLGFLPMQGHARLVIETEVVSGIITAVQDNAVELDGDGRFYYPAKKNMVMDLSPGNAVTLRYYVDNRDKPMKKYVEYAPGLGSLVHKEPPPDRKAKNK